MDSVQAERQQRGNGDRGSSQDRNAVVEEPLTQNRVLVWQQQQKDRAQGVCASQGFLNQTAVQFAPRIWAWPHFTQECQKQPQQGVNRCSPHLCVVPAAHSPLPLRTPPPPPNKTTLSHPHPEQPTHPYRTAPPQHHQQHPPAPAPRAASFALGSAPPPPHQTRPTCPTPPHLAWP